MSNLFELTRPHPQIYCFLFETSKQAAETFAGFAEFYEGEATKGLALSRKQLVEAYSLANGGWTYGDDWAGFNVPGKDIVAYEEQCGSPQFVHINIDTVSQTVVNPRSEMYGPERLVLNALAGAIQEFKTTGKPFYVIGCGKKDKGTLDHELAHAMWALDPEYKKQAQLWVDTMKTDITADATKWFIGKLKECGYNDSVVDDEIHAYIVAGFWEDYTPRPFNSYRWLNLLGCLFRHGFKTLKALLAYEKQFQDLFKSVKPKENV